MFKKLNTRKSNWFKNLFRRIVIRWRL